ncbi:hypothetical protein ACHQM5_003614 [Ranunculus cassubicifolius]
MAFLSRLRIKPLLTHRHFSSILSPDSAILTSTQKTRTALSLLKTENNPEKILDICRAAALTPELSLDRAVFSFAISSLTKSQSFESIREYLEELKQRPDLQNERSLAHYMVLYGQAGMLDHAIRTFKEMGDLGISPTSMSLNSLLLASVIARKYDEVNRIFVEFTKTFGIMPDLDTYNMLIKANIEAGSANSTYSVLAEMERKGIKPNATTFGSMLAGFYGEEKFQDVEKVLESMEKHGMKPNLNIYNIRIQSLCKLKKTAEAKELFEKMVSYRKPNAVTYHHLIYGFGKEGNVDEVRSLYLDMRRKGYEPNASCYYTLVYYLSKGGDFETALKACKESISKKWYPNIATMKMLIEGLVSTSKIEEARELIGNLKGHFERNIDKWNEIEESLPK